MKRIEYPLYPHDFGIKPRMFYRPGKEINRHIQRAIDEIILEIRLGWINDVDGASWSTKIDKTDIKIIYKDKCYTVYITEKGKTYKERAHVKGDFEPITNLRELYTEMKHLEMKHYSYHF